MENIFGLPFASKKGAPSEKNGALLQIIIVISSGILSSSAIATALKAWLDNRKTTLTIQIDGGRKTLAYEGHHLNQDAPTIQAIVEQLSENTKVVVPVDAVITLLRDDGQKEEAVLQAGSPQDPVSHDDSEQAVPRQHLSLLKRFLPLWLHWSRGATYSSVAFEKQERRIAPGSGG
jgi:Effector Associated Constant Component 1